MRIGPLATALGLLSLCACGPLGAWADAHRADRDAAAYVRLVLALGERDPDSLDFFAGDPSLVAEAHARNQTLAEIKRSAAALLDRVRGEQPSRAVEIARRQYLVGQLQAIVARIDLLSGRHFTFDEESRQLFGVDVGERDRSRFERVRQELDRLLPGAGSLGRRYAAFDRQFLVPHDQLARVMDRAVEECRRVTLDHLTLPAGEHVAVEYTSGTPWSAFTTYEGHGHSRVRINTDFALTVDRAFRLACHETYPGHHAINSLIETAKGWPELAVMPMFSPESLRTEGAATLAPDLAFPPDERLAFERDELFPLAGLDPSTAADYLRVSEGVDRLAWLQADIARRFLDGDLEFARAAEALEEGALMPSADATLKFFNEFRTYAVTYTIGREMAAQFVDTRSARDGASRWRAYRAWLLDAR